MNNDTWGEQNHVYLRSQIAQHILANEVKYSEYLDDEHFEEAKLEVMAGEESFTAYGQEYNIMRLRRYVEEAVSPVGSFLDQMCIQAFRELYPNVHVCIMTYLNSNLTFSGQYKEPPPSTADGSRGRILLHSGGHYEVLEPIHAAIGASRKKRGR
jgi:hypothetical protein